MRRIMSLAIVFAFLPALPALGANKVVLNPSNQTGNAVSGGGNEAQYALINANLAKPKIAAAGITVKVDQDFYNSPKNANSWGANAFVSIHSNAGGGHGTETLYKTSAGKSLSAKVQAALLANLPYGDRGLKLRNDLHVLNATKMTACLTEVVFHDCAKTGGYKGHPPSESSYLKTSAGQGKIATGIAAGTCAHFGKKCGSGGGTVPPVTKGWLKGVTYKAPNVADRIAGVTVKLNTGQKAISSATGYWQFELPVGTYTATASKTGWKTNSSVRKVEAGKDVWGSIGLSPAAVAPPDKDGDGVPDSKDNCPNKANKDQKDSDKDGVGDACEPPPPDKDGDGVPDSKDNCPGKANKDQKDSNKNGIGDACEPPPDGDGDGVPDSKDNCPNTANKDQKDSDKDGVGDACAPAVDAGSAAPDTGPETGSDAGANAAADAGESPDSHGDDAARPGPSDVAGDDAEDPIGDGDDRDQAGSALVQTSGAGRSGGCASGGAGGGEGPWLLLVVIAGLCGRRRWVVETS